MAVFEGKKSSNDIINNDSISVDEVVASYVPPRYLLRNKTVSKAKRLQKTKMEKKKKKKKKTKKKVKVKKKVTKKVMVMTM